METNLKSTKNPYFPTKSVLYLSKNTINQQLFADAKIVENAT